MPAPPPFVIKTNSIFEKPRDRKKGGPIANIMDPAIFNVKIKAIKVGRLGIRRKVFKLVAKVSFNEEIGLLYT